MFEHKLNHSCVVPITQGRTLNRVAKVYDYLSPLMTFGQEGYLSYKAIELLNLKGGERVLDVGCGTATSTIKIAGKLPHNKEKSFVVGLDAAPRMIEQARKKAKGIDNISFDVGIAEKLPYEDGFFDRTISTFFFHHINFELKKKSLQEIFRVLKDNAIAVIVDIDIPSNLFGSLCAWCGYFLFRQEEIKENIRGRLREAIDKSKFRSWHQVSQHLGYISIFKLVK